MISVQIEDGTAYRGRMCMGPTYSRSIHIHAAVRTAWRISKYNVDNWSTDVIH